MQRVNGRPEEISEDIMDELVCRFILNLPAVEKKPPRIFCNIKVAAWFFADNYCAIVPNV